MMEIAVVLKGQPRLVELGAAFFDRLVVQRHGAAHNFSTFYHSWDTRSRTMSSSNTAQKSCAKEFNTEIIPTEQVIGMFGAFNPVSGSVTNDHEIYSLARKIITTNRKNIVLKDFYQQHLKKMLKDTNTDSRLSFIFFQSTEDLFDPHNLLNLSDEMAHRTRINIIWDINRLAYILGQIVSSCKAIEVMVSHCERTGYRPDIVWLTRPDAVTWLPGNFFKNLPVVLSRLQNRPNPVICKEVSGSGGNVYVDDYNFFMSYDTAKKFFKYGNYHDAILEIFTDMHHLSLSLLGAGNTVQHLLWGKLGYDCWFSPPMENMIDHIVIRPGILRPDEVHSLPNHYDFFNSVRRRNETEYTYPVMNVPPTDDEILSTLHKIWS